jgi:hypothetical protein
MVTIFGKQNGVFLGNHCNDQYFCHCNVEFLARFAHTFAHTFANFLNVKYFQNYNIGPRNKTMEDKPLPADKINFSAFSDSLSALIDFCLIGIHNFQQFAADGPGAAKNAPGLYHDWKNGFGGRILRTRERSWVDVMITIFGDFSQFSAKKLAFFLNTNVMIKILHNLALF